MKTVKNIKGWISFRNPKFVTWPWCCTLFVYKERNWHVKVSLAHDCLRSSI